MNVRTAIAVAEGPAFELAPNALNSQNIGFDFNPTVDKIRVTSDADDNIRLNPDEGNLLAKDTGLASMPPSDVVVVGSAYTNSSFTATKPTATELGGSTSPPARRARWAGSATAGRSPASPPGRTSSTNARGGAVNGLTPQEPAAK